MRISSSFSQAYKCAVFHFEPYLHRIHVDAIPVHVRNHAGYTRPAGFGLHLS